MAKLSLLSCTAATVLAALSVPAAAQTVSGDTASDDSVRGDEIIVTTRKKAERLQDVPIAISAFDDASLQRMQVLNISDLSLATPSVLITQTGGSSNAAQIFIRGFGQDSLGFNSETPVAVYFDDVYMGRSQGSMMDILDLERVEILRGPQGTLYGRNSTTGAVRFVVREPDLNEVRAKGDITMGNFNRMDVRGTVSVPLIEGKLAVKLDVVSRNADGYLEGVDGSGERDGLDVNGMNRSLVRGALAWQATDRVKVDIAADISRDRSGPITATPITCEAGADSACEPTFGDPFLGGINFPDEQFFDSWGLTGKVTADLDFAEFKSISAYRELEAFDPIDLLVLPGASLPIIYGQEQEQFSQEFQLVSDNPGRLNYVLGLFYFHESWQTDSNFFNARRNVDEQTADSIAAYGEVYYDIAPGLTFTAGGRVTRDTKSIDREIFTPLDAADPTVAISPDDFEETIFTPKVAVDYSPTNDLLFYASWSRGYRPGGFGSTWPSGAVDGAGQFDAEESESYEVGMKAAAFDRRLTIDLAAYQIDYTNLQQGQLSDDAFIVTSSDAQVQGIELETTFRPTEGLSLFANLGLLDNEITRSNIPGDDLSRNLRYAPEVTYMFGGQYEVPIDAKGNRFFVAANYARVSETPMDETNTLSLLMPAYGLLDAQIGLESADERYRLSVGGRNLTDEEYWRSGVPGLSRFYAPPRTILVNLAAQF